MRIFAIFSWLVLLLSFFGCAGPSGQEKKELQTSSEQSVVANDLMTAYLVERSEKNDICVAYPVVPPEGVDKINPTIYDFIHMKTSQLCFENCSLTNTKEKPAGDSSGYSLYFLDIDYQIAYFSDEMISITFKGLFNYREAAHPVHIFFTLNLDPGSGQRINFADNYCINDALYDVFSEYAQEDIIQRAGGIWPENWGTFSEEICNRDHFLNGLTSASDFHIFYSKEGVGISYPVPYVMGDHLEVILPYSELQKIIKTRDS